jgi:hypothetical protein
MFLTCIFIERFVTPRANNTQCMKRIFCWERSTRDLTFTGRQLIEIVGNFTKMWNYILHLQGFKNTRESTENETWSSLRKL